MKKETSQKRARYRKAMLIPALMFTICMFSIHIVADENLITSREYVSENKSQEEEFIVPGKGVSDELLKEYQNIVGKYLNEDIEEEIKRENINLSEEIRNQLYPIYVQMSDKQRKTQFLGFVGPFTPFNCRNPNNEEWNYAKRVDILWFDGNKANASTLNTYARQDIYFFINGFYFEEGNKISQSALWTKKGYEAYMEQYKDKIPFSVLMEIKPIIWFRTIHN